MAAEAIVAGNVRRYFGGAPAMAGELFEGPVCHNGRLTRGVAQGERLVGDGLYPEVHGLDAALFGAMPACAGRLLTATLPEGVLFCVGPAFGHIERSLT